MRLTSDQLVFIIVSFEGPDPYSQAGGLGVRVTGLSGALAESGYETHLFFIGDPARPSVEARHEGRLTLHRWAQWISANCPDGVYHGEAAKAHDVTSSLPSHLVNELVFPSLASGRIPVLLFEEWQTAECACRVADELASAGASETALLSWNANHFYGFERIDWARLAASVQITTVSRHMRSIVRACGADARVIPNGIPSAALTPVDKRDVAKLRSSIGGRPNAGLFFKMARWEREKGWMQALDAVARARASDRQLTLIARAGGPTGTGGGLLAEADARRLRVVGFDSEEKFAEGFSDSVRAGADVVHLRFGVMPSLARTLFAASDGVLANSVSEPFGLVGLEAMAAGGVAYTGGTGEDYAVGGRNAVVLETLNPGEIVKRWEELAAAPEATARLRRYARKTAQGYEWHSVVNLLVEAITSPERAKAATAR